MKFDRTKYTAHYENGVVVAQWISVEASIDSSMGESPLDALDKSQELVQQWYKSKNLPFDSNIMPPPYGPSPVINVERTSEDVRVAKLIKDIYACTELDGDNGLKSYGKLASTCKEAQQAFDIMSRKLEYQNDQWESLDDNK